jgi:glucokinase
MTPLWAAIALGGTRSTISLARPAGDDGFEWVSAHEVATSASADATLAELTSSLAAQLTAAGAGPAAGEGDDGSAAGRGEGAGDAGLAGIGIVCGSPLDEQAGLVLAPPNLPTWTKVDVLTPFTARFGIRPVLLNDADAGALAEWAWGAARGTQNAVFLTMGTGLGAGLILGGRLYRGAARLAGEVGHWRLAGTGPVGHGKAGSFEGFCGGSGIARQAQQIAASGLIDGRPTALAPGWAAVAGLTAAQAAQAADQGDPGATALWAEVGRRLGEGLALMIDLLNPDVIVVGGIYNRQVARLEPAMRAALQQEALAASLHVCRIEPSALGERIGGWSGLAAALIGHGTTPAARLLTEAAQAASPSPPSPLERRLPRESDASDGHVRSEGSHQ